MVIRTATTADCPSIKSLLTQLGYPGLSEEEIVSKISTYSTPHYQLLVSELEGKVVGFISLHWFDIFHSPGKIGRVSAFCVDEDCRSRGVGGLLLKAAEDFLISKGCTKLEVTSNERRTQTHVFYRKRGYVEDSRRFVKYQAKYPTSSASGKQNS